MCRDIAHMYQNRIDQQQTTSYIKNLNNLFFFKPLMKYLTPRERLRFLNELCVATQVTTYAHSVHVMQIAKEVMRGVLKYNPELVELIDSHKELARKLDNLVDAGWVNIYYDIYKQYLR